MLLYLLVANRGLSNGRYDEVAAYLYPVRKLKAVLSYLVELKFVTLRVLIVRRSMRNNEIILSVMTESLFQHVAMYTSEYRVALEG